MTDQTQRLELATVKAEIGSDIISRFSNDALAAAEITTDSGNIPNLKQVIFSIQEDGAEKISFATTIYSTTAAGIAATTNGAIFLVRSADPDEIYAVYSNTAGVAVDTGKRALSATAIQTAMDVALESANAAEDSADLATARTARFLASVSTPPAIRDDGTPLQLGDRYVNTGDQAEYIYKALGWAANDSLVAIADIQDPVDPTKGAAKVGWDGETLDVQLSKGKKLANYTALRNYTGTATRVVLTQSGIAGAMLRDATVLSDDGGTTFLDGSGRGWRREFQGNVQPAWFGAVAGASSDQSAFMNAAAAAALAQGKGLTVTGTYRLYLPVNFRNVPLAAREATFLLYTADQVGLIIGGSSAQGWAPSVSIGQCLRTDNSRTVPAIQMLGSKGMHVDIGRCTHLQLYASTSATNNGSIGYCQFRLGQIDKLSWDTDPAYAAGPIGGGVGSRDQWVNENTFWLARCFEFYSGGSYRHNHNKIHGGTFENEATINIQSGNKNQFRGLRLELGPTTIIFGTETANNWIENTWDGGNDDTPGALASGTITDLGVANVVSDDFGVRRNTTCVAQAMISDPIVGFRVGELNSRQAHLQRVGGAGGNAPMCYSDMLPIEANLFFYFLYAGGDIGDTVLYRPALEFYDKNEMPINAAANWIVGNSITSVSGNVLSTSAGQAFSYATVTQAAIDAGAVFMRVAARVSSAQTANALARRIQIFASYPHNSVYQAAAFRPTQNNIAVTAAPTAGWAPVGYTVYKSDGTAIYVCTFRLKTSTTAAAAAAATSITVSDATGVAVGMIVGINMDNRDTHWTSVSAVAGNVITLTAGLVAGSASGSRVEFGKWAPK